ncbi:MAG TPA: hypothetical protein PLK35_02030 [Candidatus Moranbacteria bacterium]|nr:hypothetical protein [Candidatus Moranbacteria bacterium]
MAALVAISSDASAIVVSRWADVNQGGNAYAIKTDSETYESWLEMACTWREATYTIPLGKGWSIDDLQFDKIQSYYYDRFMISFIYKHDNQAQTFIVAEVDYYGKINVLRLKFDNSCWIDSYKILKDKAYLMLYRRDTKNIIGGEVRVYDIVKKTFRTTIGWYSKGQREVVWGEEWFGYDETYPREVIVGIAPMKFGIWTPDLPERYMKIFNAGTGELIKKFLIPPNSRVDFINKTITTMDNTSTLQVSQSTHKKRIWTEPAEE